MKTSKFFFLGLISLGLFVSSCNDDDDDDTQPGACSAPSDILIDNSESNSVTLSWDSDGSNWTIEYGETGFTQGNGTQVTANSNPFTIDGLMANTDYDFYVRNNCSDNVSAFSGPAGGSTPNPIVGLWEAYDVSPLLANFGITAISAEFFANQTYEVTSSAGASQSAFEGTYTVSADETDGIYSITLNQTVPSNATSEGIFQVYVASPDSMWYEVVQTDPALGTAPTPGEGFGSSSGGSLGNTNIQKYLRQ